MSYRREKDIMREVIQTVTAGYEIKDKAKNASPKLKEVLAQRCMSRNLQK